MCRGLSEFSWRNQSVTLLLFQQLMTNDSASSSVRDLRKKSKNESKSPRSCSVELLQYPSQIYWKGDNSQVTMICSRITEESAVDLTHLVVTIDEETAIPSFSSESVVSLANNKSCIEREHVFSSPSEVKSPLNSLESKDEEFRGTKLKSKKSTKISGQSEFDFESTDTSESEVSLNFLKQPTCLSRVSVDLRKDKICVTRSIRNSSTENTSTNISQQYRETPNPLAIGQRRKMGTLENSTFEDETVKNQTQGSIRHDANQKSKFYFQNPIGSVSSFEGTIAGCIDRSTALYTCDEGFPEISSQSSSRRTQRKSRGILSGILDSIPDAHRSSLFPKIHPRLYTNCTAEPCSVKNGGDVKYAPEQSFYWERDMRVATTRRRIQKSHQRRWGRQTTNRIEKKIKQVKSVMDKKSYYSVFRYNNGRTNPWKELVLSLLWTTIFLTFHKNYMDLGAYLGGWTIDPKFSTSFIYYFSIALGYLLYMQADASSRRWWEGRVEWQMIIENSKRLAVLLNTHVSCLQLSRFGTRMIIATTICIRNMMQERCDEVWREELLELFDETKVDKLMKQPRRLRYLAVLYGFQRVVYVCVDNKIIHWGVIRDINPTIMNIGRSLGACNRIRITQLPWVIALHLQFMVFVYIAVLPMSLVGLQWENQWDLVPITRIPTLDIYVYVIFIAYAFFGLCRMALEIDNPFSFSRENHSFGFWGFYEYFSSIEMENLRTIFGFRVKRDSQTGVRADGDYGDTWAIKKIDDPIRRVINRTLPKTHNLYNRTDKVRQQLLNKPPSLSELAMSLRDLEEECSSFTFASASEDGELTSQYRQSRFIERKPIVSRRKSLADRLSNFNVELPGSRVNLLPIF